MRALFIVVTLLLSTQTFATGGFECISLKDGELVLFGTTARMAGEPIISLSAIEGKKTISYTRDQVAGYWNYGNELKLAVLDDEFMGLDYVLETKEPAGRAHEGSTFGTLTKKDGSVLEVECIF